MKSICLIIPYFGKFKNYFQLFLNSCQNNPTVKWLIFTDNEERYFYPQNVDVIIISFDEFKKIIEDSLGYRTALNTPYKLCDFKPAYGEVLKAYIKDYDFWGYCDCDLIFGNIRKFITDEILDKNDRIFTRGHLSIFRNIESVNKYYREQSYFSFKDIAQSPNSYSFDEWRGTSKAWQLDNKRYYDELVMDDIIVGYDGLFPTKRWGGCFSPYNSSNINESKKYKTYNKIYYTFDNGTLERKWIQSNRQYKEEILYIHLQKRKMEVASNLDRDCNSFDIIDNSFVEYKDMDISEQKRRVDGWTLRNTLLEVKVNVRQFLPF